MDTTSVFLGLVKVAYDEKQAGLEAIMATTNAEREQVYLDPLTEKQVKRALLELHQLRSIESIDGQPNTWRVVEHYGRVG